MKKRSIDCVELKERGSLQVYEQVAGMTLEEELAFWSNQGAQLAAEQLERRTAQAARANQGRVKPSQTPGQ